MPNLVELRVGAYEYMVNTFKSKVLYWFPYIDSDKRMAATLAEKLLLMAKKANPRLSQVDVNTVKEKIRESVETGSKSLLEAELTVIKDLARALDNEIDSLRKGQSDPSQRLVAAFKQFFGQTLNEEEVDSYLVTPFTASQ